MKVVAVESSTARQSNGSIKRILFRPQQAFMIGRGEVKAGSVIKDKLITDFEALSEYLLKKSPGYKKTGCRVVSFFFFRRPIIF